MTYLHDGEAIYRQSFATIRAEADLTAFTPAQARIAERMIHACGMVEIASAIKISADFVSSADAALRAGSAICCDSKMVAAGITRARLPADNDIICTLDAPETRALAKRIGNTRSAAAMHLWGERMGGALVVIGNAPTALFHVLEMLEDGAPRPAAIIGVPVGFVGAAESKTALWEAQAIPCLIVQGRCGGSAMAVAAVNALASDQL
jgi:precorrin-8X/cobalt-precorrin-8 methylmutase